MKNAIEKLQCLVNNGYRNKYKEWLSMKSEELIELADYISAAQFVKEHISDSFSEDEAEYLFQFKDPLKILVDKIISLNDPNNIALREQFSYIVSDMYDKQDEYSDYELADNEGMQMQ